MTDQAPQAAFTLDQARAVGLRKDQVYRMVMVGDLHRVGRGVYVRPDMVDPTLESLAAAAAAQSAATMCLTSALVHHGLSDAVPFGTDIALPRGVRHPAGFEHVSWHSFDPTTFILGRTSLADLGGLQLHVYSAERTIIDSFRLAYREGTEVANIALRRWLAQRGNSHRPAPAGRRVPEGVAAPAAGSGGTAVTPPKRDTPAGRAYNDLRNLARRDGRDPGEYLTLYALEGILTRLARSTHADDFVLKGGVLMAAFAARRPTRDIDLAAVHVPNDVNEVEARVKDIIALDSEDGLTLTRSRWPGRSSGTRPTTPASASR